MAQRYEMSTNAGGKFWEVKMSGSTLLISYGGINRGAPRNLEKKYDSEEKTAKEMAKIIKQKIGKGYALVSDSSSSSSGSSSKRKMTTSSVSKKKKKQKKSSNNNNSENPFSEHVYILTGTLSVSRANMENEIRANGAKTGPVTRATHLLLGTNGEGTSKYDKAVERGIQIVDEKYVRNFFTENSNNNNGSSSSSSSSGGWVAPLLAKKYEEKKDPKGWLMSEKFDGLRAIWDGKLLHSRTGKLEFDAPTWFTDELPANFYLDGELWAGKGKFDETNGIVRRTGKANHEQWKKLGLRYMVYDAPDPSLKDAKFEDRISKINELLSKSDPNIVHAVKHTVCKGKEDLMKKLDAMVKKGGEGIMIREPGSKYAHKRSSTLLKLKKFHDAEAEIIGYNDGTGKYSGVVGSLLCRMDKTSGKTFKCGSGLTDDDRKNPPPIGSLITYRYQETTKDGVPRFPTYVRVREKE